MRSQDQNVNIKKFLQRKISENRDFFFIKRVTTFDQLLVNNITQLVRGLAKRQNV